MPVVLHDLLDGGVVMRRVHADDRLIERESTVLEHGCLSCTVRFDLAPALLRLAAAGEARAIVGLPPGTTAENAIDGLRAVAPGAFTVDTVALAARPEDVEDQLWDHHTLFGSGYTAVPEDSRTPGEFLVGELLFADTILTTSSDLLPDDAALSARGLHLLHELAPHAHIVPSAGLDVAKLGSHSTEQARNRNLPGVVITPTSSSEPFRTVEHRVSRPLHPGRFQTALGAISVGCCFVRGSVWIAGMLDSRVAVHGVGPRVSVEDRGPWGAYLLQGEGCRGTHLALTGDDLDDDDIAGLLDACALTDEELQSARIGFPVPFPSEQH
ncbi:GTP-binding protein [Arthrobacter sp. TB 23]|uniref:GTP-binding protein n=1 Tax=unclassified Arthrobacter TaxID=235627 RepID=UPI001ED94075|nr:GTP-binding protein [Arthrobacter sp. TB 23]